MRRALTTYAVTENTAIARFVTMLVVCCFTCILALSTSGLALADEGDESGESGAAAGAAAEAVSETVEQTVADGATVVASDIISTDASDQEAEQTAQSDEPQRQTTNADNAEGNVVDPTQRADNSFIYDTTLESLFEEPALYDNRVVQIEGEVIGDLVVVSNDPTRCWITLTSVELENKSTISVLMSRELASQIDSFGRYGITGTILQVRGEYHQACKEHDGLADIHATDVSVVMRGVDHRDVFDFNSFLPGIITIALGLALMGLFHFARERTR